MPPFASFQEIALDMRSDCGDEPFEQMAREDFARACELKGVTAVGEPTIEWALLPPMDWQDPITGEAVHFDERWGLRLTADAE